MLLKSLSSGSDCEIDYAKKAENLSQYIRTRLFRRNINTDSDVDFVSKFLIILSTKVAPPVLQGETAEYQLAPSEIQYGLRECGHP